MFYMYIRCLNRHNLFIFNVPLGFAFPQAAREILLTGLRERVATLETTEAALQQARWEPPSTFSLNLFFFTFRLTVIHW